MSQLTPPLLAWVDAVGCVLVVAGDRLTIGGPPRRGGRADLPLVAPLRAEHVAVSRAGEGWAVRALGGGLTDDPAETDAPASSFALGPDGAVRVRVAVPNALSPAAVVTVPSGHRPAPGLGAARLEAAVIAAGPVVFGPTADCHVRVREARGKVLLRPSAGGWAVREFAPPGGAGTGPARGGPAAALEWRTVAAGDAVGLAGVSLRLAAPGPAS